MSNALFWGLLAIGLIVIGIKNIQNAIIVSIISLLLSGVSIFVSISYALYPVQDKNPLDAASYLFLSLFNNTNSNNTINGNVTIINHAQNEPHAEETPVQAPTPESSPVSSSQIAPSMAMNPQSPYGQALQKEQLGLASYKDWEKANIVTETYYARKSSDGDSKSWYTSTRFTDESTGYQIGLYYADGMLFFADAYHKGERSAVTFYFWDGQMFACHDIIGGEIGLSYQGSSTYKRIVSQFGDIYAKSLQYAQYAE